MKKIIIIILFSELFFFAAFSQCYSVSSITYNSALFTGTQVILTDDEYSQVISIGFNFCFYGDSYNKLVIGANGVLSFDTTYAGTSSLTYSVFIPSAGGTRNSIMFPSADLYPPGGGVISYSLAGVAPNRMFAISFDSVNYYGSGTLKLVSYVILYETTNIIEIHSGNIPQWTLEMTEGIQNSFGNLATAVPGRNFAIWSAVNDAWRFTPTCNVCTGVGINETKAEANIAFVSPNPATNQLTIDNGKLKIKEIEIYNVLGEKVFSEQPQTSNFRTHTVDVCHLTSGIYFLKVKREKEEMVTKFVKQ
jgi:Secretion system C-terminal sorting domain